MDKFSSSGATQLFISDWLSPYDIQSCTIPIWRSNLLLSNSLLKCDQFLLAWAIFRTGTTFKDGLANESHWMQPMLVACTHRSLVPRNCSSPTDSILMTYNHVQYQIGDRTYCSQTHFWSVTSDPLTVHWWPGIVSHAIVHLDWLSPCDIQSFTIPN
jgi:hypothetical protein